MHIGIDATCWQNRRGYGRHARALLTALVELAGTHQYTFCIDSPDGLESLPCAADVKQVRTRVATAQAAAFNGRRSTADLWRMSRALSDPSFDVVFFPTIYSYVPVMGRAKKVVMIHDLIAESFPQWTQPTRAGQLFWNIKTALGRAQADELVTVSEYSRQALVQRYALPPEQIGIVGEAPDPVFRLLENPQPSPRLIAQGLDGAQRWIVYVGGFSPHKNLGMLVDAFCQLAHNPGCDDIRLVLVGEDKGDVFYGEAPRLRAQIRAYGIDDRVIFTGFLPDPELVTLLNLATVFVLPSLMEGFGLPAVEAAACGCPVIVTTASPLPLIFQDAALYLDPHRTETLTRALNELLTDSARRRELGTRGQAAAARLTWTAAARQLETILTSALA